jgi:hypothetical protein
MAGSQLIKKVVRIQESEFRINKCDSNVLPILISESSSLTPVFILTTEF